MKVSSSGLWELVRSMSHSEKRYFSLWANSKGRQKENNQFRLFKAIEKQTAFDEAALIRSLGGSMSKGQFAVTKIKLYDQLLEAITRFNKTNMPEIKCREMVNQAKVLRRKGLYHQAVQVIKRAKKIASKYEFYLLSLELSTLENELTAYLKLKPGVYLEAIQDLSSETKENLDAFEKYITVRELIDRVRYLNMLKSLSMLDEDQASSLTEVANAMKVLENEKALGFRSKAMIYDVLAHHAEIINHDDSSMLLYRKQLVELFRKNPFQIELRPRNYLAALYNLLVSQVVRELHSEFESYWSELETYFHTLPLKLARRPIYAQAFERVHTIRLLYYNRTRAFHEGAKYAEKIAPKIHQYEDRLNPNFLFSMYGLIAMNYFGLGNFDKCQDWLNTILNHPLRHSMKDTQAFSRIMTILIYVEQEELILLEYFISQTRRYLDKDKPFRFYEAVLACSKRLLADPGFRKRDFKKSLLHSYEMLKSDPYEQQLFVYFNFEEWLSG